MVTGVVRGGIKKNCFFFTFCQIGGGVSANTKNPYQKILRFFFTKGGVLPNPKNPYQKKLRWSKKGGGISDC